MIILNKKEISMWILKLHTNFKALWRACTGIMSVPSTKLKTNILIIWFLVNSKCINTVLKIHAVLQNSLEKKISDDITEDYD